jgi:hypothetical protein
MANPLLTLEDAARLGPASLLTSAETAKALRIRIRTLESWRANNVGPAFVRLGPRRIAYRVRDVLAFAGDVAADRNEVAA